MRKIIFLVLIVVVAVIIGIFCWREFTIPDINFVTDYTADQGENQLTVNRLYAADVDEAAFSAALESIMNITDYDEDEILAAAIASGEPEFYPSFHFSVYRIGEDLFALDGYIDIEMADNQTENRFNFGEISLEAVSQNLTFGDLNINPVIGSESENAVKIVSGQQIALDLTHVSSYEIELYGNTGMVTLQYKYSVKSDTFLPKTVLNDQIIQLHINISVGADGNVNAEFIKEPYSNLEELDAE